MKKFDFDYVVIGSGAAGGAAAKMAAGAGWKVALIEAGMWGGTGLSYRDIPYGAALSFAQSYYTAVRGAKFGLSSVNLKYNYPTAINWRMSIMKKLGAGSKKELEETGITCLKGRAHFLSPFEVAVGEQKLSAKKFLIATGTRPNESGITGAAISDLKNTNEVRCLTPSEVLMTTRLPKVAMVVGAGSTGCEIAEYLATLGVQVLLAELAERILPREDVEVGELMEKHLTDDLKIKVLTKSRVVSVQKDGAAKKVIFMREGQEKSVRVETIVLATGVQPNCDLGLENAGVKYDKDGIKVDKALQTTTKHIFAAGDVVDNDCKISSMEKAAYEGALATSNLINKARGAANYRGFISLTETLPRVASVGLNEDECVKRDLKYQKAVVDTEGVIAADLSCQKLGLAKILATKEGKILGATIVGSQAELVIQEIVVAMRANLKVLDLAAAPHASRSMGELVRLAARKLVK